MLIGKVGSGAVFNRSGSAPKKSDDIFIGDKSHDFLVVFGGNYFQPVPNGKNLIVTPTNRFEKLKYRMTSSETFKLTPYA
jgi:hypothetical protein